MNSAVTQIDEDKLNSFLMQVATDLAACSAGFMTNIGHKLGLYKAMAGAGHLTSAEVAARAGTAERYTREWLNSQAAGGYVRYRPQDQTYVLPPEQALVLAAEDGPCFFPPALEVSASMWFDETRILDVFRSGKGFPWGEHHGRLFCGVAAFFRSGYTANLVPKWLPALDGVVERLRKGIKVADVGCGYGHSTIIMAQAFPNSRFYGYDNHAESIEAARRNAEAAGVADRVSFHAAGIKEMPNEQFDLVCFFDALHDMGDPVGAACHACNVLAKDGTVMLVEPFAHDSVEDNLNVVGRIYYSGSTTLCCAHSLSEEVGLALGAQAGEKRIAEVMREAGFSRFRRATETPFNLIFEARK
ncbi:MAG: methyltransferase domain-containing protein [Pseudomonadota bacterium]|nr:methyltransferase domain-containing protein [Pseudomonadota bacterium]